MQIVIDIPEDRYNRLISERDLPFRLDIEEYISDGTPLPKGHGRLIDANSVDKIVKPIEPSDAEWGMTAETDDRCDCLTKNFISIRNETIGYGRSLSVGLSFVKNEIYAYYDHTCDDGTTKKLSIKFCPLCGRRLNTESEDKE